MLFRCMNWSRYARGSAGHTVARMLERFRVVELVGNRRFAAGGREVGSGDRRALASHVGAIAAGIADYVHTARAINRKGQAAATARRPIVVAPTTGDLDSNAEDADILAVG